MVPVEPHPTAMLKENVPDAYPTRQRVTSNFLCEFLCARVVDNVASFSRKKNHLFFPGFHFFSVASPLNPTNTGIAMGTISVVTLMVLVSDGINLWVALRSSYY